jgi:hypothetical protein
MYVWCADQDTDEGSGAHKNAECFQATIGTPFQIDKFDYQVSAVESPATVNIKVYAYNGNAPGNEIGSQNLGANNLTVGAHSYDFNPPIQINQAGFCVGIDADDAFALVHDNTGAAANRSFIEAPACSINNYQSLESINFPANHCVSAYISN